MNAETIPVTLLLLAALAQEWRYHRMRRDIVMDRQPLFHGAKALHVITALKLGPDQALLPSVKAFVDGLETTGHGSSTPASPSSLARNRVSFPPKSGMHSS
jgi:hypothetical protein